MSQYQLNSKLNLAALQAETNSHHLKVTSSEKNFPNPVEYLATSVNSCLIISAGMIAKFHHLSLTAFELSNQVETDKLPNSNVSVVTKMNIKVKINGLKESDQQDFLDHVLHVSTVYRSLQKAFTIEVSLT